MQTTPGKLGITSCYCIVSDLVFSRQWAIYSGLLYDLTDYIYTLKQQSDVTSTYSFLDLDIVDIFKQQAGQDITKALNAVLSGKDMDTIGKNIQCLKDAFSWGGIDCCKSACCQVQNLLWCPNDIDAAQVYVSSTISTGGLALMHLCSLGHIAAPQQVYT